MPRILPQQSAMTPFLNTSWLDLEWQDIELPTLPPIHSEAIRTQVFTHRSFFARPSHIFEDPAGDPSPDNESLEHLGDTVLNLVVTILLNDMYPNLRVGPCTKVRALVVGNETLSRISNLYRLPTLLRLHPAQRLTLQASVHIQADVFEAYVGGLFKDQGLEAVRSWLNLLLCPYAEAAYSHVRAQHGLLPHPDPLEPPLSAEFPVSGIPIQLGNDLQSGSSPLAMAAPPWTRLPGFDHSPPAGYLSLFNQYLQQHNKFAEWRFSKLSGKGMETTPIWNVEALVDGVCIGTGNGVTKKGAKNLAAQQGLAELGVHVVRWASAIIPYVPRLARV